MTSSESKMMTFLDYRSPQLLSRILAAKLDAEKKNKKKKKNTSTIVLETAGLNSALEPLRI